MLELGKLYEERQLALTSTYDLEKLVKELEVQVNELNLEKQRLELQLSEASRKSTLVFALSLLATVLVGIGVNIATTTPSDWSGWTMIVAGCLIEGVAFFSRPSR
ncbi:MAG: hypothetical protein BroJett011_19760 [Chloroflexota bacterium]|nr:MAG: hypothetical protein BroJett011_19760 [Chloroflexota bacterium]